ncbi:hypothetical protein FRC01_004421 [Tulasnella sp. 417]|nr:hypothetical protein FRC01_004421 [Tulasnella sp. 417]
MVHQSSKSFEFLTTRLSNAVVKFSKTVVADGPGLPSVQYLLKNRAQVMTQYQGNRASKYRTGAAGGDTPYKSLLRLYTFFVVGWGSQGRQEVEYFWKQKDWMLLQIPDPQDPDRVRLGILVVLVRLLAKDFNVLLEGGLQRGEALPSPLRVSNPEEKGDIVLETVPEWVEQFNRVTGDKNEWIHVPDAVGYPGVNDPGLSAEFKEVGVIVKEPRFRLKLDA